MSLEKYQKIAKGIRPIKKSIGWTDMTCNPIKGKCKGGCWYCWAKPFYKRGFLKEEIRLDLSVFNKLPKKTLRKIFLCSTHDLFGDWISPVWRTLIFNYMQLFPQHTFQILTKFPQTIDRPMPDNVWLGVSVTEDKDFWRLIELEKHKATVRFISIEPFLKYLSSSLTIKLKEFDWLIFGRLTGYGNKYNPKKDWLASEMRYLKGWLNKPIFMKDNLRSIWREDLIQEFPEVK